MFGSFNPVNPNHVNKGYNPQQQGYAGVQQRGTTSYGKSVYQIPPQMQMYQGAQRFTSQYPLPTTSVHTRASYPVPPQTVVTQKTTVIHISQSTQPHRKPYPVQPMPVQTTFTTVPQNTVYRSGTLTVTNIRTPQHPAPQMNWAPPSGYARPLPMPPFQMPPMHPASYTMVPPNQTYTSTAFPVSNMGHPPAIQWHAPLQHGMQPPYQQQRPVFPYQGAPQLPRPTEFQRHQNELMQGHTRTMNSPPSYNESEASPSHRVPQPQKQSAPPVSTPEPKPVKTDSNDESKEFLVAAEKLGIDDLSDLDAKSLKQAFTQKTDAIFAARKQVLEECGFASIQPDLTPLTDKTLRQSGLSSEDIESKSPQEKQQAALTFFKGQLNELNQARKSLRSLLPDTPKAQQQTPTEKAFTPQEQKAAEILMFSSPDKIKDLASLEEAVSDFKEEAMEIQQALKTIQDKYIDEDEEPSSDDMDEINEMLLQNGRDRDDLQHMGIMEKFATAQITVKNKLAEADAAAKLLRTKIAPDQS